MAVRVVIVGAGGHGREVFDVVEACGGAEVVGFVDDGTPDASLVEALGHRLLGTTAALDDLTDVAVLIGIGDPRIRAEVASRLHAPPAPAMVHPLASMGSGCSIGPGSVVAAGARLTTNISLGQHCYVGPNATIGHDTRLRDFATLYPGAVVSGSVTVGRAATVGAAASVKQGIHIGAQSRVGMGAAATHDVPEASTVVGVPARRVGPR
jgi:sugar O-acyltransferase (sialic acid O-acetyltransferase NeuD family)